MICRLVLNACMISRERSRLSRNWLMHATMPPPCHLTALTSPFTGLWCQRRTNENTTIHNFFQLELVTILLVISYCDAVQFVLLNRTVLNCWMQYKCKFNWERLKHKVETDAWCSRDLSYGYSKLQPKYSVVFRVIKHSVDWHQVQKYVESLKPFLL